MTERIRNSWKAVSGLSFLIMVAVIIVAAVTGMWVLTAIPVGFLFGFFLEKGDLCGASSFSEAFMFGDWRKLGGIGVVIVTSMPGFALLQFLGLVNLNPNPFIWANYIVGGILFGTGIVLAGGCVSGCLFKTGQGNLNTMAALVGIPLGVQAVAYGPLHGLNEMLKTNVIKSASGGPVTLSTLTGLPYSLLAFIIAVVTILTAVLLRKKKKSPTSPNETLSVREDKPFFERILTRPWKPWQAGIAIGILACFAYLSCNVSGRNYPLGLLHGVMDVQVLITEYPVQHKWFKEGYEPKILTGEMEEISSTEKRKPEKKVLWWQLLVVIFMVMGAFLSANMSGKFRFAPRPPDEMVVAFFGGIILGAGASIAIGCVVGNIMSGWALMSAGSFLFGITVLAASWATTYFYLMGRQSS